MAPGSKSLGSAVELPGRDPALFGTKRRKDVRVTGHRFLEVFRDVLTGSIRGTRRAWSNFDRCGLGRGQTRRGRDPRLAPTMRHGPTATAFGESNRRAADWKLRESTPGRRHHNRYQ